MNLFRGLVLLALLCGSCALANASAIDFKMNVLDPPAFPTNPITSAPFQVSFIPCVQNELPGNNTADGCFSGVNRSGYDWTELLLVFDNNSALHAQPASCNTASSALVFSSVSCDFDPAPQQYFLDFSGGAIRNGQFFFITEEGVIPPEAFGTGTATVNNTAVTPEPSSFLMLASGLGMAVLAWKPEQ